MCFFFLFDKSSSSLCTICRMIQLLLDCLPPVSSSSLSLLPIVSVSEALVAVNSLIFGCLNSSPLTSALVLLLQLRVLSASASSSLSSSFPITVNLLAPMIAMA